MGKHCSYGALIRCGCGCAMSTSNSQLCCKILCQDMLGLDEIYGDAVQELPVAHVGRQPTVFSAGQQRIHSSSQAAVKRGDERLLESGHSSDGFQVPPVSREALIKHHEHRWTAAMGGNCTSYEVCFQFFPQTQLHMLPHFCSLCKMIHVACCLTLHKVCPYEVSPVCGKSSA